MSETLTGVGDQGAQPHPLGRLGLVAVTGPRAAIAARLAHLQPVGRAIAGATEEPRINKGLQQPQRVAEARLPIRRDPALTQPEHARGQIRPPSFRQDEKAAIVGNQMQAILLVTPVPADPTIAGRAFSDRGADHQQCQPLPLPGGDTPERVADLRHRTQVMMHVEQRAETRILVNRDRSQHDVAQVQCRSRHAKRGHRVMQQNGGCPRSRASPSATGSDRGRTDSPCVCPPCVW